MKKTFVIAITWATYGAFAEKYHLMRRVLHSPQVVTVITLQVIFFTSPFSIIYFFYFCFHKILETFNKMLVFYIFSFHLEFITWE